MPSICHKCVGDGFLAAEVKEQGNPGPCKYCGQTREALPLEALADRVHKVLDEYFELVPSDPTDGYGLFLQREGFWPDGEPVAIVISGVMLVSDEIANDLRKVLHQRHDYRLDYKDSLDVDDAYGVESFYKEREPDDGPFRLLWTRFQDEIRSTSRFFSANAGDLLGRIFEDLSTHEAFDDRPVIREIGPSDEDRFVWRARVAQSTKQLETILKSPTREIGPPPSLWGKDGQIRPPGGRMNAPGIPVFYGATDMDTCVTEVRPPVGSYVVAARFEMLRTLRLLDLDALEWIYVKEGYFDPEFTNRRSKALFLQWLAKEISRPVMPRDEAVEYLATQAMAEYLANRPEQRLDGIVFRSSQTSGPGHNVVLFTHARGVKPHNLAQGTRVLTHIPLTGHRDPRHKYGAIHVYEPVSPDPPPAQVSPIRKVGGHVYLNLTNDTSPDSAYEHDEHHDALSYDEPALRLDLESVVVLNITDVNYKSNSHAVKWHQAEDPHPPVSRRTRQGPGPPRGP